MSTGSIDPVSIDSLLVVFDIFPGLFEHQITAVVPLEEVHILIVAWDGGIELQGYGLGESDRPRGMDRNRDVGSQARFVG